MEKVSSEPTTVAEEASQWLLRLQSATAEERTEFFQWLKQSPVHVREILLAVSVEELIQRNRKLLQPVRNSDDASHVIEFVEFDRSSLPRETGRKFSAWRIAAAACIVAMAGLLTALLTVSWSSSRLATDAAEWRTITLGDGSVIVLGPRSRVRVDLRDRQRHVWLARGEVSFSVAKDPRRPFVVDTDFGTVRAVGTRFTVALRDHGTVVTVAEGSVLVSRSVPPGSITVSADQQTSTSPMSDLVAHEVDVRLESAWVNRQLIFDHETLGDAIEEFNRRNRVQLRVGDRAIASLPVRGVFDADDPLAFAETIAIAHGTTLKRGSGVVRILPRRANDAPDRQGPRP